MPRSVGSRLHSHESWSRACGMRRRSSSLAICIATVQRSCSARELFTSKTSSKVTARVTTSAAAAAAVEPGNLVATLTVTRAALARAAMRMSHALTREPATRESRSAVPPTRPSMGLA
eukprot:scaffold48270_cov69-Phaeocystis_antarctica.AAC.2